MYVFADNLFLVNTLWHNKLKPSTRVFMHLCVCGDQVSAPLTQGRRGSWGDWLTAAEAESAESRVRQLMKRRRAENENEKFGDSPKSKYLCRCLAARRLSIKYCPLASVASRAATLFGHLSVLKVKSSAGTSLFGHNRLLSSVPTNRHCRNRRTRGETPHFLCACFGFRRDV